MWLWDEWPGRWGADAGIDLVAEDRDGHLWAIQAKAYDPAYWVTKHDVDTFLSESGRPRVLVPAADRDDRPDRAHRQAHDRGAGEAGERSCCSRDLEAAEVDWPALPVGSACPAAATEATPALISAKRSTTVVKGFDQADRGQLIMACGTGKTLTALFINEKLAAERTLVLVPSLSLLAQTLREWTANTTVEFDFLPVCSDETVAEPDAVGGEHQ